MVPFENLSGDASQDYFSDGITEELITQLGRMQGEGAHIVALGSALGYRGTRKAPRQIARELGVAYVLNGMLRRAGNRVRVAAHLTRGRDEAHVWDDSYDCDLGDAPVPAEPGGRRHRLQPGGAPRPEAAAPAVRKTSPEALEAHLKGRFFWNKRNPADLFKALDYFRRAQALDPGLRPVLRRPGRLLPAPAGLRRDGRAGAQRGHAQGPRGSGRQALAMDPDLAEAHASLAHLQLVYDWDWAGVRAVLPPGAGPEPVQRHGPPVGHPPSSWKVLGPSGGCPGGDPAGRAELDPRRDRALPCPGGGLRFRPPLPGSGVRR